MGHLKAPIAAGPAWHWGIFNLSYADLTVWFLMIVVFVLAIVVPFPREDES